MIRLLSRWVASFALSVALLPAALCAQHEAATVQELMLDQSAAPGAIAPAFSPDGNLVVFGKTVGEQTVLYEATNHAGAWSEAHVASFSGVYTDIEPAFAPNGRYLLFSSNRPLLPGGPLAEGTYDNKVRPGKGGHLWRVDRTSKGWGKPFPLSAAVNASDSTFSPSISADETLYFMRPVLAGERFHLYRCRRVHGQYTAPERASFSNLDVYGDFDPAVARDGSFLIFSSPRPPALAHRSDLFIVYRTSAGWSQPIDLRTALAEEVYGVEARMSPNETTLFFTNSRKLPIDPPTSPEHPYAQHTWQVDMSVLKQLAVTESGRSTR